MIIYDLICRDRHTFEGWFASAAAFEAQLAAEQIRCPICDDSRIEKRPSAKVLVARHAQQHPSGEPPADETGDSGIDVVQHVSTHTPADFLSRLREMVQATENVGERFPEEARKMHYRETPARPIRGQASREDVEALVEEGIDLTLLPAFLLHKTN